MDCGPMIVIDTHVLIWAVNDDGQLGASARATIEETSKNDRVLVSAISPWEVAMLSQKGRLSLGREVGAWIAEALDLPGIQLAPIEPSIAVDSVRLPGTLHPDPADRFIIATARYANAPLMTADQAILTYGEAGHVSTINAAE
jgi:PIN domain nuclease of toxin-antitoxin system